MRAWVPIVVAAALLTAACASAGPTLVATEEAAGETAVPTATVTQPQTTPAEAEEVEAGAPPTATATAPSSPGEPTPRVAPNQPAVEPPPTTCPAAPAVGAVDAASKSTTSVDMNADGTADEMTVYQVDDASGAQAWRVRVELSPNAVLDSPLGFAVTTTAVEALGAADVDGDGVAGELFTVVGAGASALIVAIHTRVGCDLLPVGQAGSPTTFAIGGSVGNLVGFECLDADQDGVADSFVAWTGQADFESAEGQYLVSGVEYQLQGTELVQIGTRSLVANLGQADFVYGQLSCGPINL